MTLRVVIVDDQALVRAGFEKILDTEPDITVVAAGADGEEAVSLADRHHPDIVLMDIRMPRLDGIAATRRIVAGVPSPTKVLMLTTYGIDEYVFEALRAGASGFMVKDASPEDLVAAVRTIARGDALLDPTVTRAVIDEFVRRSPRPRNPGRELDRLTEREREVLNLLTRGYSNTEIANTLVVGDATVKTHITHVLMKLGVRDRVQAVIYAYENGLIKPGGARPSSETE